MNKWVYKEGDGLYASYNGKLDSQCAASLEEENDAKCVRLQLSSVTETGCDMLCRRISPRKTPSNPPEIHANFTNGIPSYAIRSLLKAPRVTSIKASWCGFDQQAAVLFAASSTLKSFSIMGRFTQFLVEGLSCNTSITHLDLSSCALKSVLPLSHSMPLVSLNVSYNIIEETSDLLAVTTLADLSISNNMLRDKGVAPLWKHTSLRSLNVAANYLREDGLRPAIGNTTLTFLDLSGNNVGDRVLEEFVRSASVKTLSLQMCGVKTPTALALAQNTKIEHLMLDRWDIKQSIVDALATSVSIRKLEMGDVDDVDLGVFEHNTTLTSLAITGSIESSHLQPVAKMPSLADLKWDGHLSFFLAQDLAKNMSLKRISADSTEHYVLKTLAENEGLEDVAIKCGAVSMEDAVALVNSKARFLLHIYTFNVDEETMQILGDYPYLVEFYGTRQEQCSEDEMRAKAKLVKRTHANARRIKDLSSNFMVCVGIFARLKANMRIKRVQ